jgi:hypothetical protein
MLIVTPVYDVWVVVDTEFGTVPHGHETADSDQTMPDVVVHELGVV